jgi:hypothetical protein
LSLLPGSVDGFESKAIMWRVSGLLLMFVMVADLARSTRWVRRFTYSMAISGVSLAAFGIWQKTSPNPLQIWPTNTPPPTVFGPYWYHANAAALLNMTWPLTLVAACWAFKGQRGHWAKACWTAGTGIILAGLFMNVSKAGHLIALGLLVLGLLILASRLPALVAEHGWKHIAAFGTLALIALAAAFVGTDSGARSSRWTEWAHRSEWDSRFTTSRICLEMLPASGAFGSGPGTFIGVFHQKVAKLEGYSTTTWKFAHNDILQYFVEWGVLGGLAWMTLWGHGLVSVFSQFWSVIRPAFRPERKRTRRGRERWAQSFEALRGYLLFGCSLALLGVLIHSTADFPLQIMSLQIYALTLTGMLIAVPRTGSSESNEEA